MIAEAPIACAQCYKGWPQVTFKNYHESDETLPLRCDSCLVSESRVSQIAEKIDEAQAGDKPTVARVVHVSGIESKTNLRGFMFATHQGAQPLILTTLTVFFAKDDEGTCYQYHNVPVAVCEAWYVAESLGSYFVQFIKHSYDYEKIK